MQNFYTKLDHLDLICVTGKDSELFLQGQLSCDVNALSDPGACPGCLCDNKGRVIASFTLWHISDCYYLELSEDMAEIVLPHLKKYSVFYKTELSKSESRFLRYALAGELARLELGKLFPATPFTDGLTLVKNGLILHIHQLQQNQFELWIDTQVAVETDIALLDTLETAPFSAWQRLEIDRGFYHLQLEDSGLYTPQELNYDLLGHVSFTKGCYTGQEIVARMHYRGKAKKRLHKILIETESKPARQQKIIDSSNKAIGEVIQSLEISSEQYVALMVSASPEDRPLKLENSPNALVSFIN